MSRITLLAVLLLTVFKPSAATLDASCGEVVTLATHASTTTRYALARPSAEVKQAMPIALLLLAGGGGHVDLDNRGCARALTGNFLIRSLAQFHAEGFITAVADAPSNRPGEDGLAGFRVSAEHADDLGKLIADVRVRTGAAVWLVGTSRGTISAVNVASRLAGQSAPDGVVLTSVLTVGNPSRLRPWVNQTVFDLRLEAIRIPVLIIGHADDACLRSPAARMSAIAARIQTERKQVVTVIGGAGGGGAPNLDACVGRTPHGFIDQEAEVIRGIARFVRGASY